MNDDLTTLLNKVDEIGGLAFMTGGEARKRVCRQVEYIKTTYLVDKTRFAELAKEMVTWYNTDNDTIPAHW